MGFLENGLKIEWRRLSEISAQEERDEALNLLLELVWEEASHDAQPDHVGIDDVLLGLLSSIWPFPVLNFELGVLCYSLDDCMGDFGVLLNIVLPEIFVHIF
jgi:hypothetical protein